MNKNKYIIYKYILIVYYIFIVSAGTATELAPSTGILYTKALYKCSNFKNTNQIFL
jgi:hypothetical protein